MTRRTPSEATDVVDQSTPDSAGGRRPGYRRSAGSPRGEARRQDLLDRVTDDLAANGLVDSGPRTWLAPALLTVALDVAEHASTPGPRFATLCEPALVNGAAGIIAKTRSGVVAVVGITVINARIAEIDLILDADKLAGLTINQ